VAGVEAGFDLPDKEEKAVAVDYFLKIDGIPGESRDAKHKEEIEVLSWSWGESAVGQPGTGSGAGAGKVQFQDFHFTSLISKASPKLMEACASGKHMKNAVLTARRAGGGNVEFLTLALSDVLVASYQTGGAESETAPVDSAALRFSQIRVEYRVMRPDGTLGSPVKFGWDSAKNKKL